MALIRRKDEREERSTATDSAREGEWRRSRRGPPWTLSVFSTDGAGSVSCRSWRLVAEGQEIGGRGSWRLVGHGDRWKRVVEEGHGDRWVMEIDGRGSWRLVEEGRRDRWKRVMEIGGRGSWR